ncbi:MAG: hypothetical protein Q4E89_02600 [Eubacteriales bacterium]|nr:hypothetical protein [Eubacteriales bacterium]
MQAAAFRKRLFDNVKEVLYDRVNIKDICPMTDQDYTVRGCTALMEAIGGAIHHIGNIHKYARSEDVPVRREISGRLACLRRGVSPF